MADTETPPTERKSRKSVAFSEGTSIMDADGNISDAVHGEDRTSAEKHTTSPPSGDSQQVDKMTEMFAEMSAMKKKPSKSKAAAAAAAAAAAEDGEEAPTPAQGIDFNKEKKKKKKSTKLKAADNAFDAKLAKAGVKGGDDGGAAGEANEEVVEQEGDPIAGSGIWAHNASTPISYPLLLKRFFTLLNQYNPDILSSGSKSYKIPPPQCLREGNKKTIFANIAEICKRMKRNDEHVTQFLFAELGTSGSVDGSKRLVIRGRFQQKQIESVLRRYIGEYVTCKTCRSPDTDLNKGENRLNFVTCNSCGSRRSVTTIKPGYTAIIGKRKRQQA